MDNVFEYDKTSENTETKPKIRYITIYSGGKWVRRLYGTVHEISQGHVRIETTEEGPVDVYGGTIVVTDN